MSNYGRNFAFKAQPTSSPVAYNDVVYRDERGEVRQSIKVIPGKEPKAPTVIASCRAAWARLEIPIDATLWQWIESDVCYELGPNERIIAGCKLEIRVVPNGRSDAISLANSRAELERAQHRIRLTGRFFA